MDSAELINMVANGAPSSEVSDALKSMMFAKSAEFVDAAAPEVVEGFLRQAEQAIHDPRLVGSCDELALEALYQAAGDLSRASDALAYSVSQRVPTLWSEEETAELQDSVDAHGTNLRRVHASIANLSTRSFPECVSQHARSVEMWPLPG